MNNLKLTVSALFLLIGLVGFSQSTSIPNVLNLKSAKQSGEILENKYNNKELDSNKDFIIKNANAYCKIKKWDCNLLYDNLLYNSYNKYISIFTKYFLSKVIYVNIILLAGIRFYIHF